jgi:IS30 family transposase
MKTSMDCIRQSFPKGMEFDTVSAREITAVQPELNDRPCAMLH